MSARVSQWIGWGRLFWLLLVAVPLSASGQAPPFHEACAQIASLSATGLTTGSTNGIVGASIAAGEVVTMTATLGTATGGTFRIVGDPGGALTLAGPSSIPGTLKWAGAPIPPPGIGVGYFIDSATGGTVNITASCGLVQIPTLSDNMLILMAGLLLLAGVVAVAARMRTR